MSLIEKIRGWKALIHDAVHLTTDLVEEGHESSARNILRVLEPFEAVAGPARLIDGVRRLGLTGVLGSIRVINRAVELLTSTGLLIAEEVGNNGGNKESALFSPGTPVPMRSDVTGSAAWLSDAAIGLVNGVLGDTLHEKKNPLSMPMSIRYQDRYLELSTDGPSFDIDNAGSRLVLFVHGLSTTEWSWCLEASTYHGDPSANFGTLLARELNLTPLYARYNTGRHVSENGRQLSEVLRIVEQRWPVPIEELILVGHSMGGLVVRSACFLGDEAKHSWVGKVKKVISLGSPHRGAPLAKLGHLVTFALTSVDTPGTKITGKLLAGRSAGIKDLRQGTLVDEDWKSKDPDALDSGPNREIPLLSHVSYSFFSSTVTQDPDHPLGVLMGDLLVRESSAHGPASDTGVKHHQFPIETGRFGSVLHHQLQNHPSMYTELKRICGQPSVSESELQTKEHHS